MIRIRPAAACVLALTGCGGDSAATQATPTPIPPVSAAPTPTADLRTARPGTGSADLTFVGSVAGGLALDGTLNCLRISGQGPQEFDVAFSGRVGGRLYHFTVTIHNRTAGGDYPITQSGNKVEFSSDNGDTIWDGYAGHVTVAADGKSGAFAVSASAGGTLAAPQQKVAISGPFTCG